VKSVEADETDDVEYSEFNDADEFFLFNFGVSEPALLLRTATGPGAASG
jgi:hypothetical protein